MDTLTTVAQIAGGAGFLAMWVATFQTTRLRFLAVEAGGVVAVASHWLMLGSVSGALAGVVALATNLGSSRLETLTVRRWYWVLYPAAAGVIAPGVTSPADLLVVAGTLGAVAARHTTSLRRLRYVAIAGALAWLAYGAATASLPQIGFSLAVVGSHLYMLTRRERPRASTPAAATRDSSESTASSDSRTNTEITAEGHMLP